MSKEVIF